MEPLILGPSGRPVFTEHEVEVNTCSEVEVQGPDGLNGVFLVRLTNFRFIFQDTRSLRPNSELATSTASNTTHKMLHWGNIASTSVGKSFLWWRSTTLTLQLYGPTNTIEEGNNVTLTLSSEQFDKFVRDVKLQQDRRSWVRKNCIFLLSNPRMLSFTNLILLLASLSYGISGYDW